MAGATKRSSEPWNRWWRCAISCWDCRQKVRAWLMVAVNGARVWPGGGSRSEEHTSELQSLMRISYAVFCLKKKKTRLTRQNMKHQHRIRGNKCSIIRYVI